MNDADKTKLLMDAVSQLAAMGKRETDDRLEMCLTIWKFVVELKNFQVFQVRLIAKADVFAEECSRQDFLQKIARIETECERLEHILANALKPSGSTPPGAK